MAVLAKQTAVVTLKGLNQKSPGTIGAPGELEVAENLIAKRGGNGQFEFVRRNGMTRVIQGSGLTKDGHRLAKFGSSLIYCSTSTTPMQYEPGAAALIPINPFRQNQVPPPFQFGKNSISLPLGIGSGAVTTPSQSYLDIACYLTTSLYVWVNDAGALVYLLYDTATDTVLANGTLVASGVTNCKCVTLGTSFYVFWKEANAIRACSVMATYPSTVGTVTTVVAAGSALAGTDYDIQAGFDASNIALMYRASAGNHVRCLVAGSTLVVGTSVNDATAANQPDVAQCWLTQYVYGGSLYYATINAANGSKLQTINAATLASTATITNGTITAAVNAVGYVSAGGAPALVYEQTGAAPHNHYIMSTAGGAELYGHCLISRVFMHSPSGLAAEAVPYAIGAYNSATGATAIQDSYELISMNGVLRVSGRFMYGNAGRAPTGHVSSAPVDSTGTLRILGQNVVLVTSSAAGALVIQYGITELSLSPGAPTLGGPVEFGGACLLPGAQVWEMYSVGDANTQVHELGFHHQPEPPTLAEGAAASGNVQPGTYSVIAAYKWIDRSGQVLYSSPSTPVAITTVNANSSIQVTTPTYRHPTRSQTQIALFRTPINGDGSIYFKTTPAVFVGPYGFTTPAQLFVDTASDAAVQAGEPFTPSSAGGELENTPPPPMHVIVEHKNRLFGIMSEAPHRIAFSKEYVPGTSLGFFDGFVINTPQTTGPIYALASMDGHLIAIKRDCIYVIDGDFPDATGGGPQIPLPTVIPTGVGTTAPRSVVVTSHGVMFHSVTKGFWLLNRSLQATYIGAQVEATANTGLVVISGAAVMSDRTQVRWTSEGGTSFVLDTYFLEQGTPVWTTFTGQACVHSIVHLGRWYHLTAAGDIKVENAFWRNGSQPGETGAFTNGVEYFGKLTVADINFGGILGFLRCWRGQLLGEWFGAHKVKVTLQRNHRTISENPFTFDATVDPDPYMMEFRPQIQKATSLAVTIEEVTTGSQQTQGAAWTALAFSVGIKPGVSRLPQTKTMVGS